MSLPADVGDIAGGFQHDALLYESPAQFLRGSLGFIREGLAGGESVMAVTYAANLDLLREALGGDAARVQLLDMEAVGANPSLIIPLWSDFVDSATRAGTRIRGIGEPIFLDRRPAEIVECQRHEALLNIAFDRGTAWRLLCPYDVSKLDGSVINEAQRVHAHVHHASGAKFDLRSVGDGETPPYEGPLPPPPRRHFVMQFGVHDLESVRRLVSARAQAAGLSDERADRLVVAVNEVATNSLRHAGGAGTLRVWEEGGALVCEVVDGGHLVNPLIDRLRPSEDIRVSRGLWLANHLCDLLPIRSSADGTVVRAYMWLSQTKES